MKFLSLVKGIGKKKSTLNILLLNVQLFFLEIRRETWTSLIILVFQILVQIEKIEIINTSQNGNN